MRASRIQIEVCIDSVQSALAAHRGGADRVELCQNLFEGGTTPSAGMIRVVRSAVPLGVFVIIRPRGGDFCYDRVEFDVMQQDIIAAKQLGVDGIVLGVLLKDGRVDSKRTADLIKLARPLPVTFHRAFDMTRDPREALEDVIELGCERVLTSGQEKSVLEGLDTIAALVKQARNRIIVMPGAGITERNFAKIRKGSGAREFHMSASASLSSKMVFRNKRCSMGKELRPPEFEMSVADGPRIAQFRRAADES